MVGSWTGWSALAGEGANSISVTFTADGGYIAQEQGQPANPSNPAFCFGVDDANLKQYELDTVWSNNEGAGLIQFGFGIPGDFQDGQLDHLRFCDNGNQLNFDIWDTWTGPTVGPCAVTLVRVP